MKHFILPFARTREQTQTKPKPGDGGAGNQHKTTSSTTQLKSKNIKSRREKGRRQERLGVREITTEESERERRQHHHPWQLCCWHHSLEKVTVVRGILSGSGEGQPGEMLGLCGWLGKFASGGWVRLSSVRLLSNATVCHGYNTL